MHSYENRTGRLPDFIVNYRLYSPIEGGRKVTFQHLRCDFMYAGDIPFDNLYAIYPQFLDDKGHALGKENPVPLKGRATMWILNPEMRTTVHQARIKVGTRGHFMEGARKVGDVEVTQIERLHENIT